MKNIIKKPMLEEKSAIIVRGISKNEAIILADTLYNAGIRFLEITMNTENAEEIIYSLREKFDGKMYIGAGTVTSVERAIMAKSCGAQFFLAPDTDERVIKYANGENILMIPGALTPTEITAAYKMGGDIIKVFPVTQLGPTYIKDVLAPIDYIPLMAVGGVNCENAKSFIKCGASAVGLGSSIVRKDLISAGKFDEIYDITRNFVETLK